MTQHIMASWFSKVFEDEELFLSHKLHLTGSFPHKFHLMPQIQAAPPSEVAEVEPSTIAQIPTEQLSLEEMIRIMDVATALRKEQAIVEQQLSLEDTKSILRDKLLEAAKITGEYLTNEQIDLAIESYFDKLHTYEKPKWSMSLFLAHLYVMRGTIMKWTLALGAATGALYYFF